MTQLTNTTTYDQNYGLNDEHKSRTTYMANDEECWEAEFSKIWKAIGFPKLVFSKLMHFQSVGSITPRIASQHCELLGWQGIIGIVGSIYQFEEDCNSISLYLVPWRPIACSNFLALQIEFFLLKNPSWKLDCFLNSFSLIFS